MASNRSMTLGLALMTALLVFGLMSGSAAAQAVIPGGAIVDEAWLGLNVTNLPSTAQLVSISQVSSGWNELEVTWLNATSSNAWDTPGGDYAGPPLKSFTPVTGWQEIDVTAMVQAWVNGSPNFGIMLEQDLAGTRFSSSEVTIDSGTFRPALIVKYHTASDPTQVTVRIERGINGSDVADATVNSQNQSENDGGRLQLAMGVGSGLLKRALLRFGFDLTPPPPPPSGSIGDRAWNDTNGDGVQDASENGISGVAVNLRDGNGGTLSTQTTSGDGAYTFASLPTGAYEVCIDPTTMPEGFSQTYDPDGLSSANCTITTLAAGQSRTDLDFGYWQPALFGDRVWNDANGNGMQDAGETGFGWITVILKDSTGNVFPTNTDGLGTYIFASLPAGTYEVCVDTTTSLMGFSQTYDLDGLFSPNCATLNLTAGENRTDVDFGYWQPAALGDRVWNDANGNGVQDAAGNGINGVVVILRDGSGSTLSTQTTNGDGAYTFGRLPAGTYQVCVDATTLPAGFSQTYNLDGLSSANCATTPLAAGQNRTDVDFGYWQPAALGDRVWNDANGNGMQDAGETSFGWIAVILKDSAGKVLRTTFTDSLYTFGSLPGGAYQVCVDAPTLPASFGQTYDLDGLSTPNCATATLAAGQNRSDVDFGYWQVPGSCSYILGYWKTHSKYGPAPYDATWAKVGEDKLFFSTRLSWYAIISSSSSGGDAYTILGRQYVAAHLNQKAGVSISSISSAMTHAQYLLDRYDGSPYLSSVITGAVRGDFIETANTLDMFNNGLIGPGHCQ